MKYSNTSQKSSTVKRAKTYNSRNSRVVTHRTTTLPVYGLSTAERTGCSIFHNLWSYVLVSRHFTVYQNWARQIPPTHRALSLQEPTVLCSRYNRIMVSLHHSFDCKSIMLFLQGETRDSSRQSKAFITRQVTGGRSKLTEVRTRYARFIHLCHCLRLKLFVTHDKQHELLIVIRFAKGRIGPIGDDDDGRAAGVVDSR